MKDAKYLKDDVLYHYRKFKIKVCKVRNDAVNWCRRNPQAAIALIGTGSSVIAFLLKNGIKHLNLRKEEKIKREYVYDTSLGHYWNLRRKLSNQEWLDIERRRKSGECLGDILSSMNVLK